MIAREKLCWNIFTSNRNFLIGSRYPWRISGMSAEHFLVYFFFSSEFSRFHTCTMLQEIIASLHQYTMRCFYFQLSWKSFKRFFFHYVIETWKIFLEKVNPGSTVTIENKRLHMLLRKSLEMFFKLHYLK